MSLTIISRQDAISKGLSRFYTGVPCQHGHLAERIVSSMRCHECHRIRKQELRADNPAKYQAQSRAKYHKDPLRHRAYRKSYYGNNAELEKQRRRDYYEANKTLELSRALEWKQLNKERVIKMKAAWHQRNLPKVLATNSIRRAQILKATPTWLDKKAIELIYKQCASVTKATKVKHHVDHIVPLKSKHVCGLHVPWNLQIIPATENLKKHNKFPYDRN